MTRRYLLLESLCIAAAIAVTAVVYNGLPGQVATHWDLHLQPNGYSPKWALFLIGPGAMAGILLLSLLGPWLSPRQFAVDAFYSTWTRITFLLFCLMAYLYVVILWAGAGHKIDEGRVILGGVCVFAAMAGNLLGKIRRNFFMGIRTPWTLASEPVWYATHRLAAKTVTAAGVLGLLLTLIGARGWPVIVLIAGALIPALYSLVFYKREQSEAAERQ
jgi:uncharacterized membrane protein